jgi:hypothetical protein
MIVRKSALQWTFESSANSSSTALRISGALFLRDGILHRRGRARGSLLDEATAAASCARLSVALRVD